MKLVVGLGNPGPQYRETRHNVGFWVIDALCERLQTVCTRERFKGLIGESRIGTERVMLCKPQTFMNLSGESVREICRFYSELDERNDVIIVYDDMDFQPGQLKLRQKGSAGGHNGIKSIIQCLGTEEFSRVRIGIGRPEPGREVIGHVLGQFTAEDRTLVDAAVRRAVDAIEFAVRNSFGLAMNRFNE